MYADKLSPSERADVEHLYGTSIEDALSMGKTTWDYEQGFAYIEDFDNHGESHHTYVLDFDDTKSTMLHPHNLFSPIVYELPSEEIFTVDDEMYENVFDAEDLRDQIDELYKYAEGNPHVVSRIKHPNGAITNVQLLDFAAANIQDANINFLSMQYVFSRITKFLGIKAPNVDEQPVIDHLNGIDIFLLPDDTQTERSGIFKNIDGVKIGGFAFTQANGRYAMAIIDGNANLKIAAHEFGHILDFIAGGKDEVTDKISPDLLEASFITKEDITRYGTTKDSELFADSFAVASLGLRVNRVKYEDGNIHIALNNLSDTDRLLQIIFGEPKIDDLTVDIHTKYHNLFRLMLKGAMPVASAAIQKSKKAPQG